VFIFIEQINQEVYIMDIIFFAPDCNGTAEPLRKTIENKFPGEHIEFYKDIGSIAAKLNHCNGRNTILILVAENETELLDLYSYRYLILRFPVLLLIPDIDDLTLAIAQTYVPASHTR